MKWLLIVILMTTNAYADTNSTTLDSVVNEVLEKNPELKFFQAGIAAAKGSRKTAGLWANPEVSGSIGQKRVWNEEEDLTGRGKAGDIAVTQTFEWPGRIGLRT
jgi:cobalt-zinc-cadmium efflux system outer membrane protein